jgi:A/G-specific adenine glycosylase
MKKSNPLTADITQQVERLTDHAKEMAAQLLTWFAEHGRHTLPWQHPRKPYYVWLSEIMLQQTQVATVIPYFEKFVTRYPDIESLAAAEQDDVLSYWSGLGYYARARNLHQTARQIVAEHQGIFPQEFEELIKLKGIGRSTANAILAQAFEIPAPILDGNVRRILARITCLTQPPADSADALWKYAEIITPNHSAADYTQAIMDLGALICTRSKPKCAYCPLKRYCQAFQQNKITEYPVKKVKKPKPTKQQDFYIYLRSHGSENQAEVLLNKRPATGIWGGLWCLPTDIDIDLAKQSNAQELDTIQHSFTHYHLLLKPILCRVVAIGAQTTQGIAEAADSEYGDQQWFTLAESLKKGLPAPIRVLLENIQIAETAKNRNG